MFVLIGESGCGKSTIEKKLLEKGFSESISITTRNPRNGEVNGTDYHFVTKEKFEVIRENNELAEWAEYNGNYYGTKKEDCKEDTICVIELKGLKQLKRKDLDITSIYLKTTEEKRRENMIRRGDSEEEAKKRVEKDRKAFEGVEDEVDFVIKNETLEDLEVIVDLAVKLKDMESSVELFKKYSSLTPYIITSKGKLVNIFDLQPNDIKIEDIAHALSQICRWNGHSKYHYSVAQHSVMVSKRIEELGGTVKEQLFGLLHDASEAYICDIPKPVKAFLHDYIKIESSLQSVAYEQLVGSTPDEKEQKIVDKVDFEVLVKEAQEITNYSTMLLKGEQEIDSMSCKKQSMKKSEKEFLDLYKQLKNS